MGNDLRERGKQILRELKKYYRTIEEFYGECAATPVDLREMRISGGALKETFNLIKDQQARIEELEGALEFYTVKPEVRFDERGNRITKFVPRDDGSEYVAKQALAAIKEDGK